MALNLISEYWVKLIQFTRLHRFLAIHVRTSTILSAFNTLTLLIYRIQLEYLN